MSKQVVSNPLLPNPTELDVRLARAPSSGARAVVLVSGGLDSLTCLALAIHQGYECYALTLGYGQRHHAELESAKYYCQHYAVKAHKILELPINEFGHSALTDFSIDVPDFVPDSEAIPVTYVPARNTIFLSWALGYAEVVAADTLVVGVSAVDYSNYPDCRPEYIAAFAAMANLATQRAVEGNKMTIAAPLIQLSKADTIKVGLSLGVDYSTSVSCYQADTQGRACGQCDSCAFRAQGFAQAGHADPTRYANPSNCT